jgi:hypothetical protein
LVGGRCGSQARRTWRSEQARRPWCHCPRLSRRRRPVDSVRVVSASSTTLKTVSKSATERPEPGTDKYSWSRVSRTPFAAAYRIGAGRRNADQKTRPSPLLPAGDGDGSNPRARRQVFEHLALSRYESGSILNRMTKRELVDAVATKTERAKAVVETVLDSVVEVIVGALSRE